MALPTAIARPSKGKFLDKVGLHRGGVHPRAGRTWGLRSQVTVCQPCFCLSYGQVQEAVLKSAHGSWHTGRERAQTSWESSGRTQTGQCHTQNAQQSQLPPNPALPSWPGNRLLRGPALTPGSAGVPGEGRRMQLPCGSQGPGETEPVLKRQGGCPPSLGRLLGMTGSGLEAWTLLAPGFS